MHATIKQRRKIEKKERYKKSPELVMRNNELLPKSYAYTSIALSFSFKLSSFSWHAFLKEITSFCRKS